MRTLVDHFEAIGGIPLLAVFDRPQTIAISWKRNSETLFLYREKVQIICTRFEATHPRLLEPNTKSTLPHRSAHVAAVSGKRGKRYLQRQHLIELGRAAHEYLLSCCNAGLASGSADVERLHQLLQEHGGPKLRSAFEQGLKEQAFGAEYIA